MPPDKKLVSLEALLKERGINIPQSELDEKLKPPAKEKLFIDIQEVLANVPPTQWILKDIIERGALGLVFGEPSRGKSLFVMDWAFCIGNGIPWHNHKVKQPGKVFYIAGEGHRGIGYRFKALEQKYRMPAQNIYVSTRSINFFDADAVGELIEELTNMGESAGSPDVVFIDTFHRNFGGDENSAKDLSFYFKMTEAISKKFNCAVFTIHHSGNTESKRARGSSAQRGGYDAEFIIRAGADDKETIFEGTKMKEKEKHPPMSFFIDQVELEGERFYDPEEQEQLRSVYLTYNSNAIQDKKEKLSTRARYALDALIEIEEEKGIFAPFEVRELFKIQLEQAPSKVVKFEDWRPFVYDIFEEEIGADKTVTDAARRMAFKRIRKELFDKYYIGQLEPKTGCKTGGYVWIIKRD